MAENQDFGAQLDALHTGEPPQEQTAQELLGDQTFQALKLWQADQRQQALQDAIKGATELAAKEQGYHPEDYAGRMPGRFSEQHPTARTVSNPFAGSETPERNTAYPVRPQPAEPGTPINMPSPNEMAGLPAETVQSIKTLRERQAQLSAETAVAKQQFEQANTDLTRFDRQAGYEMQQGELGAEKDPTHDLDAMRARIENRVRNAWAMYADAEHAQQINEYKLANPGRPMPGPLTAGVQGVLAGGHDISQTRQAAQKQTPTEYEASPASEPIELGFPSWSGASKLAYQTGKSWPMLAGGTAGGVLGGLPGGVAGAIITDRIQEFGPYFAQRLKETPNDVNGAYDRALSDAGTSGIFSGASWALFAAKPFQSEIKNILLQSTVAQPGTAMAQRGYTNIKEGKPFSEGQGEAYTQGMIGALPLMAGHAAVNNIVGSHPLPGANGLGEARPTADILQPSGMQALPYGAQHPELKPPKEPQQPLQATGEQTGATPAEAPVPGAQVAPAEPHKPGEWKELPKVGDALTKTAQSETALPSPAPATTAAQASPAASPELKSPLEKLSGVPQGALQPPEAAQPGPNLHPMGAAPAEEPRLGAGPTEATTTSPLQKIAQGTLTPRMQTAVAELWGHEYGQGISPEDVPTLAKQDPKAYQYIVDQLQRVARVIGEKDGIGIDPEDVPAFAKQYPQQYLAVLKHIEENPNAGLAQQPSGSALEKLSGIKAEPQEARPYKGEVPDFKKDITPILPKDESGAPNTKAYQDYAQAKFGKDWAYKQLTDEQKRQVYDHFSAADEIAPHVEEAARHLTEIPDTASDAKKLEGVGRYIQDRTTQAIATALHEPGQTPEQLKEKLDDFKQRYPENKAREGARSGDAAQQAAGEGNLDAGNAARNGENPAGHEPGVEQPADGGRGAAAAAEHGQRAGAEQFSAATRDKFDTILSGKTNRKQWGSSLGVDDKTLGALVDDGIARGLLMRDRNGIVRRTAKAKGIVTDEEKVAQEKTEAEGQEPIYSLTDVDQYGKGIDNLYDLPKVVAEATKAPARDIDKLGYYSQAIEAAKALKQAKGTPQQILAQLKKAGVKEAEIEATGLAKFLEGKKSVTRDEVIGHLEERRVRLDKTDQGSVPFMPRVVEDPNNPGVFDVWADDQHIGQVYQNLNGYWSADLPEGRTRSSLESSKERAVDLLATVEKNNRRSTAKWKGYSLDPRNPTYRETVLHLPEPDDKELLRQIRENGGNPLPSERNFYSGHFSEPNITGHLMTSIVKDETGRKVFNVDQIQSDWGQKLRDVGGARDEAKVAKLRQDKIDLEKRVAEARPEAEKRALELFLKAEPNGEPAQLDWIKGFTNDELVTELAAFDHDNFETGPKAYAFSDAVSKLDLVNAELRTAEATTPGHPLVNTTDQWVNTTLRTAIRQAAESGADAISIPSGETVLSYNPGDAHGMGEFYGKIVPKNLRNLLKKLDPETPDPQRIEKLETPTQGAKGKGFTIFPLTERAKEAALTEGQPLFHVSPAEINTINRAVADTGWYTTPRKELAGLHAIAEPLVDAMAPEGTRVYFLDRVWENEQTGETWADYVTQDGKVASIRADKSGLGLDAGRALVNGFFKPGTRSVFLNAVSVPTSETGIQAIRSVIVHELAHVVRYDGSWAPGGLDERDFFRVLRHSNALGILDMPSSELHAMLGYPETGTATATPMRQRYEKQYANRFNRQELIDQEAVSFAAQLYHTWKENKDPRLAQFDPVKEQMEKLLEGGYAERGDMPLAKTSPDLIYSSAMNKSLWQEIATLDKQLSGEGKRAVDAWVGGPHDSITMGLEGGLMVPDRLEKMSDADLEKMARPIRDVLRQQFGNTLTVYRGEVLGAGQSHGRQNKLASFTLDRHVAENFAGVEGKKDIPLITDAEIKAAEARLRKTGEVELRGRIYRTNPQDPVYIDMFDRNGNYITDTDSIRSDVEDRNDYWRENNEDRKKGLQNVRAYEIPIDSVVWVTDRFNQKEVIAKASAANRGSLSLGDSEPRSEPLYSLSATHDRDAPELAGLRQSLVTLRKQLKMPQSSGERVGVAKDSYAYQLADALALAIDKAGEHLDSKLGPDFEKLKAGHSLELERLAPAGSTDRLQDGYRAFMREYIENSDAARAAAPKFYTAFEDHLDESADPRIWQSLQGIQDALDQPGVRRLMTSVDADPHFTGAFGMGRHQMYEKLGKAYDGYINADAAYSAVKGDVAKANDFLRALPDDQRAYVLFNTNRDVARVHPIVRANKIADIVHQVASELVMRKLRDTSFHDRDNIQLGPERMNEVNDLLTQYAAAELHNAFIQTGSPDFAMADAVKARLALNDLRAVAPEVAAELHRRLKRENIAGPITTARFFPIIEKQVQAEWDNAAQANKIFSAKWPETTAQRFWKAPAGFSNAGGGGWQPPKPPAGGGRGPTGEPIEPGPLGKALDFARRQIAPETISDDALRAGARFAEYNSATQQRKDAAVKMFHDYNKEWNKRPDADSINFFRNYERGDIDQMSPWEREFADFIRPWMDWAYKAEVEYGSKAAYRENYLSHLWDLSDKQVADHFAKPDVQKRLGPDWFQKARVFDYIDEGLGAGYKLRFTNPAEIVTKRLMASIDMQERMRLLQDLRDVYGQAAKDKGAPPLLDSLGWQQIKAPDQEQWRISPDIQPIWDNVIAQTGWWGTQNFGGSVYRGWMGLKALWVPIKLSVSGFHPLHVVGINWASHVARAAQNAYVSGKFAVKGEGGKSKELLGLALEDAGRALDPLGLRYAIKGGKDSGWAAREAWLKPEDQQTPEDKALMQRIHEMGMSTQMPEELKANSRKEFDKAWKEAKRQWNEDQQALWLDPQYKLPLTAAKIAFEHGGIAGAAVGGALFGIPGAMAGAAVDIGMRHFIFERWIPAMKISAALLDDAAMAARHPEIYNDQQLRAVARRAIGEQNENRFGEMFYKNMFWNKKLRESMTALYLSLGWQTGFVREHLGAPVSLAIRTTDAARGLVGHQTTETKQAIRAAENKLLYVPVYLLGGMMAASFLQYYRTGEWPDWSNPLNLDLQMPRVGGKNADGSPRRVSTMWYNREYVAWVKHMQEQGGGWKGAYEGTKEMNWNKMMLQPLYQIYSGEDYYKNQIRDPEADLATKIAQTYKSIMSEQLQPMSLNNAQEALKSSSSPIGDTTLSLLGFGPAPAYVSRTPTQNRIAYLYREYNQGARPYTEVEIKKAQMEAKKAWTAAQQIEDKNERQKAEYAAREALNKAGAKIPAKDYDVTLFQKLPASDQLAILEGAPPAEAMKYLPKASHKLYANPVFWDLQKQIVAGAHPVSPAIH